MGVSSRSQYLYSSQLHLSLFLIYLLSFFSLFSLKCSHMLRAMWLLLTCT